LPARQNLANTLFALAEYSASDQEYFTVLEQDADNDAAWNGRFECSFAKTDIDKCHSILRDWQRSLQLTQTYYLASARLLRHEGKDMEALRTLQCAAKAEDSEAEVYALMCEILLASNRLEDGLAMIRTAITLQPYNLIYRCKMASIYFLLSDITKCSEAMHAASMFFPESAILLLNQYLLFPVIPTSAEQIAECRVQFEEGLCKAESMPSLQLITQHPVSLHTFTLAYHNQNDRGLLERYSTLMRRLADPLLSEFIKKRAKATSSSPLVSKDQEAKIRIGFLSSYFYGHSNTMAFQGLIRFLDRGQFQVILIHGIGSIDDAVKDEINSFADEIVTLTNDLYSIYAQLHDLQLDILFFTDLGMSHFDFLYPFFRASPIQITGWGIPHTSGSSYVDYYISAEGVEPDGAEELYTEKLIRLPGGLPCCFYSDSLDTPEVGREYFFLPYHCKLIGCLQSLHKLHPDFDLLLEAVAIRNPDAIFVFVEDTYSCSTELFLHRLGSFAPTAKEQTLVLTKMQRGEYQALCKCMDILLDPIYYGSGITFFEAVLAGTPIVTLEGRYLRSRVVSSGYREMGIFDPPIARSNSEYVEIVHDLLENDDKRNSLRKQILCQRHRVVNRADYVRHFEEFCLTVTGLKQSECLEANK
ncbi:O-linked N-acetylglucosamine transferase family protein, partial [Vulcanococcus limneticus]